MSCQSLQMKSGNFVIYTLLLIIVFLQAACTPNNESFIVDDISLSDETRTSDWLAYGRTHNERRFSPLEDINTNNVADLKVDWYIDLPKDVGLVSTPLVVDGILYFSGTMNVVRAVDAVSGELIWEFDPEVGKEIKGKKQEGWVHSRSISFYKGKVFTATWDGRLIALEAKTGKKVWSVVTFDPDRALYITGVPKAFKDRVIIGNGGTEDGPTRGFVTAYDVNTGREVWKFYIVPGNPAEGFENEAMEMAAKTWTGEWYKHCGKAALISVKISPFVSFFDSKTIYIDSQKEICEYQKDSWLQRSNRESSRRYPEFGPGRIYSRGIP